MPEFNGLHQMFIKELIVKLNEVENSVETIQRDITLIKVWGTVFLFVVNTLAVTFGGKAAEWIIEMLF